MSTIDYEDLETDTIYPPGHRLEPASYMRKCQIARHPLSFDNFIINKRKRQKKKDGSNKNINK